MKVLSGKMVRTKCEHTTVVELTCEVDNEELKRLPRVRELTVPWNDKVPPRALLAPDNEELRRDKEQPPTK